VVARTSSDVASALKDSVDSPVSPRSPSPVRQNQVSVDSSSRQSVSAETSTPAEVPSSPAEGLFPSPVAVTRLTRRPQRLDRHPPRDIDPDFAPVAAASSSFAVCSLAAETCFLRNTLLLLYCFLETLVADLSRRPSQAAGLSAGVVVVVLLP